MKQWLENIWNAQRNARNLERAGFTVADLESQVRSLESWSHRLAAELKVERFQHAAYAAVTATLAAEYLQAIGWRYAEESIPDSIKEAHMLRGVETNWKLKDDVRLGKAMWEKRQHAAARQQEQMKRAGLL